MAVEGLFSFQQLIVEKEREVIWLSSYPAIQDMVVGFEWLFLGRFATPDPVA